MRKRVVTLAIAAAVLNCVSAAHASSITIDFDDPGLMPGDEVGGFYDYLGVTFVDARVYLAATMISGISPDGYSGPNVISSLSGSAPMPSDPIQAIFANAVSSVTLTGESVGNGGFLLNGYGANGDLLATAQQFGGGSPGGTGPFTWFSLSLDAPDITSITFSKIVTGTDNLVTWDNLIFTPQPVSVPEPGPLVLFFTGLAGLLVARGRKQSCPATEYEPPG